MKLLRTLSATLAAALATSTFALAAPQASADLYCTSPQPQCTILDLDGQHLGTIPAGYFSGMTQLVELRLANNELEQIPAFGSLPNLKYLYLNNNHLGTVPGGIFQGLSGLQILDLSDNQISMIPPAAFTGLSSLQILALKNNQVATLHEGTFDPLTNLSVLDLDNSGLQDLSELPFGSLSSLTILSLGSNGLTELPVGVFDGANQLQYLSLSGNSISDIYASRFAGLPNLIDLNLSDNVITHLISGAFVGLATVKSINLSHNNIGAIDWGAFDAPRIESIDLSANSIVSLDPQTFDGLTWLRYLRLDNNQLASLPADLLADTLSLEEFLVANNQLHKLPAGLFDGTPYLQHVDLRGNPMECLPDGIFSGLDVTVEQDYDLPICMDALCTGTLGMAGSLRVGQPLAASGLECEPNVDLYYTWEINGSIVGTQPTYTPTANDLGYRVTLTVVAAQGMNQVTFEKPSVRSVRWFVDVPSNQRFYEAINYLAANDIISHGATNDEFHPDRNLTRGEIAAYMYRLAGRPQFSAPTTPSFTDVPKTHMFYREIEWLKSTAITSGKGSPTTFKPSDTATRGELAAFLHRLDIYRYGNRAWTAPPVASFKDVPKTHTFNWDVEWMLAFGITSPNAEYHPERECLRDEFAAFMYRYLQSTPTVVVYNR
ncbi:MAG: leucine-rich repeat domain-containing protein [Propionibacteriaceae bacterium]|jgi:Leucine-rich repeat (LRR) protein|nr:leucine-rich repeat domain-containing protein [Propionibacteriaceae bacterium]